MEWDPEQLDVRDRYKLLIGSVVPRPIAWVSTVSPDGESNLAPFSFFSAVGSNPMTLLFCPSNAPDGSEKDTLRNAKPKAEGGTGVFVVNVVQESRARAMAATAERLPFGESELELAGLTATPSHVVAAPRIHESPIAFECQTTQVLRLNPGVAGGGNLVLGRVVWIHVDDALVDDRFHVDPAKLKALGRMGGLTYCRTGERFDVPMGRAALDLPDPLADR